jgi:four helix bundle protein
MKPAPQIGNPTAEGRRPKEGRTPKSESERPGPLLADESELPPSGEPLGGASLALRENAKEAGALRPLDERTAQFGEAIIFFAKKIPQTSVNERLISQLVAAGTSIGANYAEADDSVSGKEFKLRIGTCRKESKETMFFLRMVATAEPSLSDEARVLWREAKELNLIFGAIWRK